MAPGDLAGEAARAQVVACHAGIRSREQPLVIPLDRRRHRLDQLAPLLALAPLAAGRVGELDAGLAGQALDRGDEVDVLDLLHEA